MVGVWTRASSFLQEPERAEEKLIYESKQLKLMSNYTTLLSAWRRFRGSVKARAPSTRQENKARFSSRSNAALLLICRN